MSARSTGRLRHACWRGRKRAAEIVLLQGGAEAQAAPGREHGIEQARVIEIGGDVDLSAIAGGGETVECRLTSVFLPFIEAVSETDEVGLTLLDQIEGGGGMNFLPFASASSGSPAS